MRTTLLSIVVTASALLAACGSTEKLLGSGSEPDYDAAIKVASEGRGKTVDARQAKQYGITEETYHRASLGSNQALDRKGFARALRDQFDRSDINRDGRLNPGEAVAAGLKSGRAIEKGDRNDNGSLTFSEYVRAMTLQARGASVMGQ